MSAKTAPVRPEWTTADSAGNVYFVSGRAVFKIDSTGTLTRVNPAVLAGQAFSGAARAVDAVNVQIGNWNVTPMFTGLSGAGLVQINVTIPGSLGSGDVPLVAAVGGAQTPAGVVISLE